MSLLSVHELVKHYPKGTPFVFKQKLNVRAVDGISLSIDYGEILGLVGESGCGKSTLGRLITRLEEKTEGEIYFKDQEISEIGGRDLRLIRQDIQIIFQDTASALNPRWNTKTSIKEPLQNYGFSQKDIEDKSIQLLEMVGLKESDLQKFPHQFSSGQRQRINIARALALDPALIVCDEPVSSLDVSIRAQILKLLRDLQQNLGLAFLFISHDLAAVSALANRVAVMYLGQIVEKLPVRLLTSPDIHPYTRALIEAVPKPDPNQSYSYQRPTIKGEPPDPSNPPPGCRFHPRCPISEKRCSQEAPQLTEIGAGHQVACHNIQSTR